MKTLSLLLLTSSLVSLTGGLLTSTPAFGAEDGDPPKPAKIFTTDSIIAARVEGPWSTIMRHKESEDTWEGVFRYTDGNGQDVAIPIELTTRGITRKRVCDFPPLRIRFDKDSSKDTAFRGAGNLKLVTHCLANSKYEQYYLKEFLAYRIYNVITDKSFRVQGLDLAYADDPEDKRPLERFGFLIEDPDDMAERNEMSKLDANDIGFKRFEAEEISRFMLFQYMIANLDWSVLSGRKDHCCHNGRLIGESVEATPIYPIPYDFDSSGIVNAHYASPPEGLKVRTIRQRVFRGFCPHNDAVAPITEEFKSKRPQIEALFTNEERLAKGQRKYSLKFIEDFYEEIETDSDIQELISDNCRG